MRLVSSGGFKFNCVGGRREEAPPPLEPKPLKLWLCLIWFAVCNILSLSDSLREVFSPSVGAPSLSKWCGLWWGLLYSWEPHVLHAHHSGAAQHGHKGWQRFRVLPIRACAGCKLYTQTTQTENPWHHRNADKRTTTKLS